MSNLGHLFGPYPLPYSCKQLLSAPELDDALGLESGKLSASGHNKTSLLSCLPDFLAI